MIKVECVEHNDRKLKNFFENIYKIQLSISPQMLPLAVNMDDTDAINHDTDFLISCRIRMIHMM